MPQVISANRLIDGLLVFLDRAGSWVEPFQSAAVYDDKGELELALAKAQQDVGANKVVDVAAFEVKSKSGISPFLYISWSFRNDQYKCSQNFE